RWHQEPAWPDFNSALNDAASRNQLLAFDAATGQPAWEVGGRGDEVLAGELDDCYFLGAPLPLDGRLYVLVETRGELALACLRAADGTLLLKQPLAAAPTRMLLDP